MKRLAILLNVLVLAAALGAPRVAAAADETHVTAGAGGTYPAGTSYTGVTIQGLEVGFGAELNPDGSGLGNLTAILLGVTVLGVGQNIGLEGQVTSGTRNAVNVAVLTGAATLDLGDGTPPILDVPFVLTLTKDPATNQGTVGLTIGVDNLPTATLNEGSVSIRSMPIE